MDRCGHGELIPLFGLFAALVLGAEAFDQVGMKAVDVAAQNYDYLNASTNYLSRREIRGVCPRVFH